MAKMDLPILYTLLRMLWNMFTVGLCVQIVFLFSIFDIYFKSPIVHNVAPYQPHHTQVADRLVLFMIDGLRAESFVNYTTMPYLRSIANSHGRWGISNTRVPTESRPGHVSVIAGFYEDPSAVAKGWKTNPVDFDSVFNQTRYTWCWGTYDILEIFTKGNNHIFASKFDPYDGSFSTNRNTTHLDSWVFEKAKSFFYNAKYDTSLYEKLKRNKIVFFFHLLGTDTSGHTHKPKTLNFLTTIRHVDLGVQEMERILRDFYNDDGKTTFIMTSDHGMTDWGSHGSGDDHETQTPYVIWGAGVSQTNSTQIDTRTLGMSLNNRLDINQADLAPLMSTVLSIPVPVNSIGELPADLLNMSLADKAKAIYSNSRQLASQYNQKRLEVETNAIPILYLPFKAFTKKKYDILIRLSEDLEIKGEYERLISLSKEIMRLSLAGLSYYHNYYQYPLLVLVTLSFLGWIFCLLKLLLEQKINTHASSSNKYCGNCSSIRKDYFVVLIIISGVLFYLIYVQNLPLQYYMYVLLPVVLWWYVLTSRGLGQIFKQPKRSFKGYMLLFMQTNIYVFGSVALALSFTYRWMLSIPLLGMGLWPFLSSRTYRLPLLVSLTWPTSCALLSFFSFMPVVGKKVFIELVLTAGLLWGIIYAIYIWRILLPLYRAKKETKMELILSIVHVAMLLLSLENIYVQSIRFDKGTPVSSIDQILAWCIAVISQLTHVLHTTRVPCRLLSVNTSILNFYLLLSVAHEGYFMVVLICNVLCWTLIEFKFVQIKNVKITDYKFEDINEKNNLLSVDRSIGGEDFRRAYFYLVYIILAFFGTGNIASLNSFEVRWVTCFVTSFHPFLITALVLLKTLAPFLSVACCFRAVQLLTKAPTGYLNIIVLIYSNIMGLLLLFYVRNTGSWLDIGTSISQFIIVQVITVFIVLINQLSKVLTDYSIPSIVKYKTKNI